MNKIIILLLLFLLTIFNGCLNVNIEQEIKRNGSFNMEITFHSDIPMAVSNIEEELELNSALEEFVTIKTTSNSVTYIFTNVDPTQNNLFINLNSSTSKSSLFKSKSYNLSKEFKFPFHYYRYEIKIPFDEENLEAGVNEENLFEDEFSEMFENLFNIGYNVKVFGKIINSNGGKS